MRLLSSRHIFIGILVFLTLGVNAVVAYFNIGQLISGNRQIVRTVLVVSELENLAATLKDAEAAQRGYVLTGQPEFLEGFKAARSELSSSLNTLQRSAADEQQQKRLPLLRKAIAARMESAQTGITLRRTKGLQPASAWVENGRGARQNKRINALVEAMRQRESELIETRTIEASQAADDATRTFWIETGVAFGFLALILFLLGRAARQNRELEHAYREIQRAEAMRDNLTAMLVHDLRTPLTGLLGPLQMLEAQMLGPLDDAQKEVVHISNQSGQRLLGMVNALLDVSKMEAGEFTIHPQSVEVEPAFGARIAGRAPGRGRGDRADCAQLQRGNGRGRPRSARTRVDQSVGQRAQVHAARWQDHAQRRARRRPRAFSGARYRAGHRARISREDFREVRPGREPRQGPQILDRTGPDVLQTGGRSARRAHRRAKRSRPGRDLLVCDLIRKEQGTRSKEQGRRVKQTR